MIRTAKQAFLLLGHNWRAKVSGRELFEIMKWEEMSDKEKSEYLTNQKSDPALSGESRNDD